MQIEPKDRQLVNSVSPGDLPAHPAAAETSRSVHGHPLFMQVRYRARRPLGLEPAAPTEFVHLRPPVHAGVIQSYTGCRRSFPKMGDCDLQGTRRTSGIFKFANSNRSIGSILNRMSLDDLLSVSGTMNQFARWTSIALFCASLAGCDGGGADASRSGDAESNDSTSQSNDTGRDDESRSDADDSSDPDSTVSDAADTAKRDDGGSVDADDYDGPTGGPGITPRVDYADLDQHFVSPSGSADASGSRDDPWNVDGAESNAGPGDAVRFLPGTYSSTIRPPSGTDGNPLVFHSDERHAALLDGDGEFLLEDTDHVHIQGFRFEKGDWVTLRQSSNVVVRDNYMVGSPDKNTRFFMEGSNHVKVLNNVMKNGGEHNMFIGFPEPRDEPFHNVLVAGNSFSRAGHQPAGFFFEFEKTIWRGNVFHNLIGRNGGIVGGRSTVWEHNLIASAYDGPDSGGSTAKFTVQESIYRYNKLYRNWGTPVVVSPYQDWNSPAGPLRMYNNVLAGNMGGHGWKLWGRCCADGDVEYIADTVLKNNIFDADSSEGNPQLAWKAQNEKTEMSIEHNLFAGPSAIYYEGDRSLTLDEARSEIGSNVSGNIAGRAGLEAPQEGDFTPSTQSDAVDAGAPLTTTRAAGQGRSVELEDARYFHDGFDIDGVDGDVVQIGDDVARVTDVSWSDGTIEIDRSLNWESGEPVGLPWSGSAPDMGVYEGGEQFGQIEIEAPLKAEIGEDVRFDYEIHGSIEPAEICWQFGDGSGTCGTDVSHTFEQPYDYGVRVRVIDSNGGIHWGTWYIFVSDSETQTHSAAYRDAEVEKFDNLDDTD